VKELIMSAFDIDLPLAKEGFGWSRTQGK